jgi:glycosyltransferase involved in cell wall biosynthesis
MSGKRRGTSVGFPYSQQFDELLSQFFYCPFHKKEEAMRIAVFHDYFSNIGGGERLALTMARGLNATVLTTDRDGETLRRMGAEDVEIRSIGPTVNKPPLKQISASVRFATCNVSEEYDFFVFSGNWAHHAVRRHKPNLLYCHTPVRQFYDLRGHFRETLPSILHRTLFDAWVSVHRYWDQRSITQVDRIIANSLNTKERIRRYYGRDSEVLYPPVDTSQYQFREYGDFWLSVNRLYPEKRVDLQVDAFRGLPRERLKIVGGAAEGDHSRGYAKKISEDLPSNVELLGQVAEDELVDLYARCRGLIATSLSEDFGMAPVEAMASGKPVVAVDEGGYRESVIDGRTGRLVKADVEEIRRAIREISRDPGQYKFECLERSKNFDLPLFLDKMKKWIYR